MILHSRFNLAVLTLLLPPPFASLLFFSSLSTLLLSSTRWSLVHLILTAITRDIPGMNDLYNPI